MQSIDLFEPASLCFQFRIWSKSMLKYAVPLLPALCLWLAPQESRASCSLTGGPLENNMVVLYFPAFNVSNLNPNVPNNSILASQTRRTTASHGVFRCTTSGYKLTSRGTTGSPTSDSVYPTTISGIGLRIIYSAANGQRFPYTESYSRPAGAEYANIGNITGQELRLELIKTGPITAGGALTGEFGGVFAVENGMDTQIASYRFSPGTIISPNVPTCTVTNPSVQVNMGTVPVDSFNGVGTYGGTAKDFNISLNCSGGDTGTKTKIFITLSDPNDPGNTSEMLSLMSGATNAKGVSLNIFNASGPVKFGPDSSAPNNTNQWFVTEAPNGTVTIPLSARYIQTEAVISSGTANALATFTMSYQ